MGSGTRGPNGANGTSQPSEAISATNLPGALGKLNELAKEIGEKERQLVFFLDYDGTLAPIVDIPDRARMAPEMKAVVEQLAEQYPSCIVTGRALEKIKSFVKLETITYAGSHGFEMEGPSVGRVIKGEEHRPALVEIMKRLEDDVDKTPGAHIEDNSLSVSVHYRHVAENKVEELKAAVEKEVNAGQLELKHGKKVWEIRPNYKWNKGESVKYILQKIGMEDPTRFTPVYIGDDITDEDAFKVLPPYGGIGALVFDDSSQLKDERYTAANYKLTNPEEVCEFLKFFVGSQKFRKCGGFKKDTNNEGSTATSGTGTVS